MNNVINEGKAIIEQAPIKGLSEVLTAEYTTSWRPHNARQLNDIDYMWRPTLLSCVPWYFFASMCECNRENPGALPWHSFQTSDGAWNHHPCFSLVKSKLFPDNILVNEQGFPFLTSKANATQMYYCNIITQQAWGVPSILAEFPKTPTDTSSSSEKGYFAFVHASAVPSM